jgi:hypothetical protein
MKKILLAIIICFAFSGNAQVVLSLNLITNNKKPIQDAIVKYETFVYNSNELGFIRINNYKYGKEINIRKLGFIDTTIIFNSSVLKDTLNVSVILKSKIIILDEVPVYSNKTRMINPKGANFILDYELYEGDMVQLLSDNNLLLISNENKATCNKKIHKEAKNIVKDFYGNINFITSTSAYKIKIDNSKMITDTIPMNLENFNKAINYCDGVLDTLSFVRRYKDVNQTVAFFAISTLNSKRFKLLKEISNADKKRVVKSNARKVNSLIEWIKDYNPENIDGEMGNIGHEELELRRMIERLTYEQKTLYDAPSYNTLKLINDSIYIFAHDIDTMFVYDKTCNLIRRNYIDYHHLKSWGREIIMNEEKTKIYGKFITNKNVMVAEINLATGKLKLPFFKVESGHSPKKIKIRGDIIYYLGKQPDGVGYTIYAQELQL